MPNEAYYEGVRLAASSDSFVSASFFASCALADPPVQKRSTIFQRIASSWGGVRFTPCEPNAHVSSHLALKGHSPAPGAPPSNICAMKKTTAITVQITPHDNAVFFIAAPGTAGTRTGRSGRRRAKSCATDP